MSKIEIRREALARQGGVIESAGRRFRIYGDDQKAHFETGGEGLVQTAVDERTGVDYRIKCFWDPTDERRERSNALIARQLANSGKRVADALGGAPFALVERLGAHTPFAVVMKSIAGASWKKLREQGAIDATYPPRNWPSFEVRVTWAYGLATAVKTLESRQFVHADIAPGNVIVTPHGETAGDLALVDFDGFADFARGQPTPLVRGASGYAAPEIWTDRRAAIGSDRIGMAILIQEFLIIGDASLDHHLAFDWAYDQDGEILSRTGEPHPLLRSKYPGLAELVTATLRTADPLDRPDPEQWRAALKALIEGKPAAPALCDVVIEPNAAGHSGVELRFDDRDVRLDLLPTPFGIRAALERGADGAIRVVVHDNAELRVRQPGEFRWDRLSGAQSVAVVSGLVLFDNGGHMTARITGAPGRKR